VIRRRRLRRAPVAPPPHRSGRPQPPAHARILVVDDHEDTRELLLTILKTEGYDVDLAEDGDAAVRRYRERPADIVLMDLYMPRKNGIAAIQDLSEEFPGVVIVAMSGDADLVWHDALAEARRAGAQLTLRKPLEPWLLLRTLEGLTAARRALTDRVHRSA
jgi:CheY-like chemotaxis protein